VKVSKGEINDILIQLREFIYPVDFIVLETQPVSNPRAQTPIILGRLFLATANAIINCRNGSMRLTFGDMTREVNAFNLGKQPRDVEDQTFEVNFIENLISEHREKLELETDCDLELESEDFNLDQIVEPAVNWASNTISPNIEPINLTPPSSEPSPSLELKVLLAISSTSIWANKRPFLS